ncbi:MAG: HAMP domain-containing sensor histidine kinase [Desulfosalsimonadaceae bacterium]
MYLPSPLNKKIAEITIVDNGEGMNRDILSRAGVPLFTTKANHKGLGLSIAEKLICKMGGTLEITSKKSHGTSVKVSFPITGNVPA